MGHIDALKFPSLYLLSQGILGAKRARKKCIEEYARVEPGMRVLDIGCGPGYVVQYLPKSLLFWLRYQSTVYKLCQTEIWGAGQILCSAL